MKLNKLTLVAVVAGITVLSQFVASADYINLPIKWSQPLGTNGSTILGYDRVSDHTIPWVMADDFLCNDPNPVKAVRWWGSYVGEATRRPDSVGYSVSFDVGFLSSTFNPSNPNHPNSKPNALLLSETVLAQEVFVGVDQNGDNVYRYDAYLPVQFNQVPGTEYFIAIDKPSGENWGWHDAAGPHPILDWAAVSLFGDAGPYATFQPKTDLAFEIMIPEPTAGMLTLLGGGLLLALRRRMS